MANKRMFSLDIVDGDLFLDMGLSAQALYFHLGMRADDEGFVNNPKKIVRMIGAAQDDFKLLIAKKLLIPFESGTVVVRHWQVNNNIRKDRIKKTFHKYEKEQLYIDNNTYELGNVGEYCQPTDNQVTTNRQPTVNQLSTNCQHSIDIDVGLDVDVDINSPKDSFIELDWFEKIWLEYPRKEGKNRIISKTSKLKTLYKDRENVELAVKNYAAKIKKNKTERQYTLMGSTFFNGDYKDYIIVEEAKPKTDPDWKSKIKVNVIKNNWRND